MVKRNFKKDPITEQEVLECYWYPVVDDTIGGWAISNVNESVAYLNPFEGKFELGSFLTESEAKHICDMHNQWWDIKVWGGYLSNIAHTFDREYAAGEVDRYGHSL